MRWKRNQDITPTFPQNLENYITFSYRFYPLPGQFQFSTSPYFILFYMVTYLLSTELALGKYGIKEGYWCHLGNFPKHVVCKTIQRLESLETVKELRSYLFLAYTFRCLGSGVSGGSERGNGGGSLHLPCECTCIKGLSNAPIPYQFPLPPYLLYF